MNIIPPCPPRGLTRRSLLRTTAGAATIAVGAGALPRPAIARTVKLLYWSPLDPKVSDARSRGEAAMIAVFHKLHPEIELEVQPVPWQVMGQQVIQAVMSGNGPDVAQLSTTNLPDQVAAGTAAPLNDHVGKTWTPAEEDDFILPRSNTVYDGKNMAMYWSSLLNNEFWYIRDMLDGTPPGDWTKLAAFLKPQADKRGVAGFLTGLSEQGNAIELTDWLIPAFWACGAEYVTGDGELGFVNENGAKTFEWLLGLVHDGVAPKSIISTTRDNILDAMKQRRALATILTSNIVSSARAALKDRLVLAPQPGPGGPCPAFASGKFLIMTESCKEREAAGQFIEAMVSPEAQLANAKIAKELPVRKSVVNDAWFKMPEASDLSFAIEYMAGSKHVFRYPKHTDFLQTRLALAAQQMMRGKPVLDALKDVAKEWEPVRKS